MGHAAHAESGDVALLKRSADGPDFLRGFSRAPGLALDSAAALIRGIKSNRLSFAALGNQ